MILFPFIRKKPESFVNMLGSDTNMHVEAQALTVLIQYTESKAVAVFIAMNDNFPS